MKKLIKLLLVVAISISALNGANGVKVFDLKEQIFDDLEATQIQTYKVENALVKLKLEYKQKGYFNTSNKGSSYVYIKSDKELKNWLIDEDMWIFTSILEPRTIKIYSNNNKIFTISFKGTSIEINDFKYIIKARNMPYNIKIVKLNNIIKLYIDEIQVYATQTKFDKFIKMEQTLFATTNGDGCDDLYNLKLWEIK